MNIQELLQKHTKSTSSSLSDIKDYAMRQVEDYNKSKEPPDDTGYDCQKCGNKGQIAFLSDNSSFTVRPCKCLKVRKSLRDIKNSGLGKVDDKTLENYMVTEEWQAKIKAKATEFLNEPVGKWFFIGGQSGAGKTHIAKAISVELIMNKCIAAKYLAWRKEVQKLNTKINEADGAEFLDVVYSAPILFIDDFLKSTNNAAPTQGELNRAIDIILTRYEQRDNITIISSERTIGDILNFDQAMGGRIVERAEGYMLNIPEDIKKNYRLRGLNL